MISLSRRRLCLGAALTQSDPPQSGGAEPEPPPPVTSGRGAAAIDGRPLDVSGIKVLQDVWNPHT